MTICGLDIQRMMTIVRKELLVLFGNRVSRFMIIIPPLLQIVVFGWAATMEVRNVRVAVVNNDNSLWSREIIHRLEGSKTFKSIVWLNGDQDIKKEIDDQKALFALVFDENFSRDIEKGNPAEVQALFDGRRSNAAQIATSYLGQIIGGVSATTPAAKSPMATSTPKLDLRVRCWFNPNLQYQWYFLPNLIGMLTLMIGLVVTGLSVAKEREMGTFDQLLVSPATPVEIAFAKLVPGCLIGLCHGTIFLLITVFGFGVPFNGSVLILYAGLLIFAFAAGAVGLMVSSLSSTQQQAFLGAFTVGVPCIIISGAFTPLMNMPKALQYFSEINPLRHFTVICQGVFLKDITFAAAMTSMGKITIISLVAVIVAVWMFKRRT